MNASDFSKALENQIASTITEKIQSQIYSGLTTTVIARNSNYDMKQLLELHAYDEHMTKTIVPDDILDICKEKLNDNTLTNPISLKSLDIIFLHHSIPKQAPQSYFNNRQL
jgi:hypothetical protein